MSSSLIHCEICGDEKPPKDLWWCEAEGCHLLLCSLCRVTQHDPSHGQHITAYAELRALNEVFCTLRCDEYKRQMRLRGVFVSLADALWDSASQTSARLARLHPGLEGHEERELSPPPELTVERARRLGEEMVSAMGGQKGSGADDVLDRVLEMGVAGLQRELRKVLKVDRGNSACSQPTKQPEESAAAGSKVGANPSKTIAKRVEAATKPSDPEAGKIKAEVKQEKEPRVIPTASSSSKTSASASKASPAPPVAKPTAKVEPTSSTPGRVFVLGGEGRETQIESLFPSHVESLVLEGRPYLAVRAKTAGGQLSAFLDGPKRQVQIFRVGSDERLKTTRMAGGAKRSHQGGAIVACRPSDYGPALFLLGGGEGSRAEECEKLQAAMWHRLPKMSHRRSHFAAAELGGHLYAIGGDGGKPGGQLVGGGEGSRAEECEKLQAAMWHRLPKMSHRRSHFAAAELGGHLYAIGGDGGKPGGQLVGGGEGSRAEECEKLQAAMWHRLPKMSHRRSHFAAAELGGHLYAIGGDGGKPGGKSTSPLSSVERLPVSGRGEWEAVASLPQALRHHAAASLKGTVVVAGGERDKGFSSKVTGWLNLQATWLMGLGDGGAVFWRPGPDLNVARRRHGLVTLNGSIYAIGGTGFSAGVERSVERLSRDLGRWKLLEEKLALPAVGSCFAIT